MHRTNEDLCFGRGVRYELVSIGACWKDWDDETCIVADVLRVVSVATEYEVAARMRRHGTEVLDQVTGLRNGAPPEKEPVRRGYYDAPIER